MKIQILLLVFVGLFAIVQTSYAQEPYPQEDPSLYEVTLQLQLRDSEGQLITYIEPTTKYIANINMVHQFLDTKENKIVIEKEGKMFEEIRYEQTFGFSETKQIATVGMWYEGNFVLLFRTDGFLTSPGDTLDAYWKIVRIIQ